MSGTSSTPLSTMKTLQKHLYSYSVLPRPAATSRVRSNSASRSSAYTTNSAGVPLSFFDTPPPPPRPHIMNSGRIAVEARADMESGNSNVPNSTLPLSLALTAPLHNSPSSSPTFSSHAAFFPYSSITTSTTTHSSNKSSSKAPSYHKQQKFQLDVGAYGIPKKCRNHVMNSQERQRAARGLHTQALDDSNLSVQVGEDAYFIRDNAMGVADGVGGWDRMRLRGKSTSTSTPSGLFARRLMHFCSDEVAHTNPHLLPPFHISDAPIASGSRPIPIPSSSASSSYVSFDPFGLSADDMQEQLDDSLEELEEGIDVLMILERAYQNTLKAHVVPSASSHIPSSILSDSPRLPPDKTQLSTSLPTHTSIPRSPLPFAEPSSSSGKTEPLLAGSSTALLAVLDHIPRRDVKEDVNAGYDAVIKIAHIGDCMGMLIRGEEIIWRSEEMWWSFNTPVQLGPSASVSPKSCAHVFTLPVQADDILILASDGLSDNLWDEDIFDEVSRFRTAYLASSPPTFDSSPDDSPILSLLASSASDSAKTTTTAAERIRWRRTLASMLSEALCSRARKVSERKVNPNVAVEEDEVPFARRAREEGKDFRGGKNDDISVVVAVISPAADLAQQD